MKYLITGITGFAGPHLSNILLQNKHEVYGLTRRTNGMETDILDVVPVESYERIKFVVGDLTDRESILKIFREHKFDGVFHLAAMSLPSQSFIDPVGTFRDNVMGSVNLIDAVEQTQGLNCKLMLCSTSETYGNAGSDGRLIKETQPMSPANPYGASKSCAEIFMQERMLNGKINGFITRAFSHSGSRRGKNFSISSDAYQISQFILSTKNAHSLFKQRFPAEDPEEVEKRLGLFYTLKVGNLSTTRVVIDVRDCCAAYVALMENEKSSGEIFNVCGEVPRRMEYFTDELIRLSGLNIKKEIYKPFYRDIDIYYQHGDTTKLRELTGWEPKIPIEETLQSLLDYWVAKLSKNT